MARELTIVDIRVLQSMEIEKNGIRSLSRQQKCILVIIMIIIIITIIVIKVAMVKKNTENLDQRFMTLA